MDCYLQIIAQMHAAHVETQLQLKVKEKSESIGCCAWMVSR